MFLCWIRACTYQLCALLRASLRLQGKTIKLSCQPCNPPEWKQSQILLIIICHICTSVVWLCGTYFGGHHMCTLLCRLIADYQVAAPLAWWSRDCGWVTCVLCTVSGVVAAGSDALTLEEDCMLAGFVPLLSLPQVPVFVDSTLNRVRASTLQCRIVLSIPVTVYSVHLQSNIRSYIYHSVADDLDKDVVTLRMAYLGHFGF